LLLEKYKAHNEINKQHSTEGRLSMADNQKNYKKKKTIHREVAGEINWR
jgi:hypothetical protein